MEHRHVRIRWVASLIVLTLPMAVFAQPVDVLISQLSSADWRTRQAALEKLVARGEDALPHLQREAGRTHDVEVRSRAQAAIARIEENRLVGASPITVNWNNSSALTAVSELAAQARAPLPTEPVNLLAKTTKRVSLQADHRPFWDVMLQLCRQTALAPAPINRHNRDIGLGLLRDEGNEWGEKLLTTSGPLLIRADRLISDRAILFKTPNDTTRELSISMTIFAEPKLRVLDYSGSLRLDEVVDVHGNSLIPPDDGDLASNVDVFGNGRGSNTSSWEVGATLRYPKGAGNNNRIARFRASTTLIVQTQSATLELPLPSPKHVNRTVDGLRVTVKNLDAGRCDLTIHRDGRNEAEWNAVRMQMFAGEAQLLDDKGQTVARSQSGLEADESPDNQRMELRLRFGRDGVEESRERPSKKLSAEAVKMVWEFPTQTRELVVPFEFRNLPIP